MKIQEKLWFNELLEKHPIRHYENISPDDCEIIRELEVISSFLQNYRTSKVIYTLNPEKIPEILGYLSETKPLVKNEEVLHYLKYIESHCRIITDVDYANTLKSLAKIYKEYEELYA